MEYNKIVDVSIRYEANQNEKENNLSSIIFNLKFKKQPEGEIERYINDRLEHEKANIYDFWRKNIKEYPNLYMLAKRYLGSAGSSLDTEREASLESKFLVKYRSNIGTDTLEELVISNKYIKHLKFSNSLID